MWTAAHVKRGVFLVHRWTGVAACVLMALWVFSGVVMLFVGYPKMLPIQRLAALPVLSSVQCCVPLEEALRHSPVPEGVAQMTLTTIAGHPSYRFKEADGTLRVVDAITGAVAQPVDEATALQSAQAFLPGANSVGTQRVEDDRWTRSRSLNAHRPFVQLQMDDSAASLVYVSSRTGEVVMHVPRYQRYWNYVGAWLHWVYMFRDGSKDPVWSWLVIVLSALGTFSAVAGAFVGIWRWRFAGRYKTGSKTPYREFQMRWHHITGLVFGSVLLLWIFSGLMSMNPFGIFNASGARPDLVAYAQGDLDSKLPNLSAHKALEVLRAEGFDARELAWKALNGQAYLLAVNGVGDTRVVSDADGAYRVQQRWEPVSLAQAAQRLLAFEPRSVDWLHAYDAYYYRRGEASMYGNAERDLPVLRVQFEDPGNTIVYISPKSGDVVLSLDRTQRTSRWLFNFLHSWDLSWMLKHAWPRDVALVLLSMGAFALTLTGVVLGYRRCVLFFGQKFRARKPKLVR